MICWSYSQYFDLNYILFTYKSCILILRYLDLTYLHLTKSESNINLNMSLAQLQPQLVSLVYWYCHTRPNLELNFGWVPACKSQLASWATKWHDYVPVDHHHHPPDGLLKNWEHRSLGVWKLFEGVWVVSR